MGISRGFRSLFIPMALLCAAWAQQEPSAPKPAEPRRFEMPVAVAQGRRVLAFEFTAGGYKYHVARSGLGTRSSDNAPARSFNLHLSKGDFIRSLYFAEYQGDALVLAEVSNGTYGAGFLVRVGGSTPDIKWKQTLPGFNVGRGLIEGDFAYVTALRFVGKVNLRSGSYAWRHRALKDERGFEAFDVPRVEGDTVLFQARRPSGQHPMTVTADKQTGRIVSPAFFAQSERETR